MTSECEAILAKIRHADLPCFFDVAVDSVHAKGRSFGDTPLHIVANWGDAEAIVVLLDNGAEIDAQGEHGFTPLHEAVCHRKLEAARRLVERGASLTIRNDWGQNAMDLVDLLKKKEETSIELCGWNNVERWEI